MNYEEAIIDIKENIKPVVGGISLDMAIEALEKRIPKKVIPFENNPYLDACQCCGRIKSIYGERYCSYCGQRLDWKV